MNEEQPFCPLPLRTTERWRTENMIGFLVEDIESCLQVDPGMGETWPRGRVAENSATSFGKVSFSFSLFPNCAAYLLLYISLPFSTYTIN